MRIKLLIGTALAVAGLLAGCGGGGSKSSSQTGSLRTLMGYVYVKSSTNTNSSDPDVIITPASTPPAEPHKYDVPIAGSVTLIVENGTILQKSSGSNTGTSFTKDLSTGNDIIVNINLETGGQVNVAGSGVTSGTETKYLSQFTTTLADGNASGTSCLLRSPGDPETRTPDSANIASMKFTLDGVATSDSNEIIAGDKKYLAIGYVDVNGLAVPGVPSIGSGVTLTSSESAKVKIDSTNNILTTAIKGQDVGDVTIHASINSPSAAEGDITMSYAFGDPANVAIYRKTASGLSRLDIATLDPVVMRWNIATSPRTSTTPTYMTLVAEITNKYGASMKGIKVNWSNPKVTSNVWKTTSGGYAFVDPSDDEVPAPSTTTDGNGQTTVRFQAPTAVDGPLDGKPGDAYGNDGENDQVVKAMNFVFATVDGTSTANTSPAKFFLTRQFNNVSIAEAQVSKYAIVNAYTTVPYTAYATDVDGWECKESVIFKWRVVNTQGGHKVGDPGEEDLIAHIAPTSVASFNGSNLSTGAVAGEATIYAYTGADEDLVESPAYAIQIWGPPAQIICGDGPNDKSADRPWEFAKVPTAVTPFGSPASELVEGHFEPNGDTPPLYVCYLYLCTTDTWGYRLVGTRKIYRVTGIPATIPDGFTFNVTYTSPLGYGSASSPDSPMGDGRPLIVVWGPATGMNGEIAISWSGTWSGSDSNAPLPTTSVPFSVTRRIRVYNGG